MNDKENPFPRGIQIIVLIHVLGQPMEWDTDACTASVFDDATKYMLIRKSQLHLCV